MPTGEIMFVAGQRANREGGGGNKGRTAVLMTSCSENLVPPTKKHIPDEVRWREVRLTRVRKRVDIVRRDEPRTRSILERIDPI